MEKSGSTITRMIVSLPSRTDFLEAGRDGKASALSLVRLLSGRRAVHRVAALLWSCRKPGEGVCPNRLLCVCLAEEGGAGDEEGSRARIVSLFQKRDGMRVCKSRHLLSVKD